MLLLDMEAARALLSRVAVKLKIRLNFLCSSSIYIFCRSFDVV